MYTDNRMLYIDYTPLEFPFTFEFEYEMESTSTAFLPRWDPSPRYNVSTEKSSYTINNTREVPLVSKKYNLDEYNVQYEENPTKYHYQLSNLPAVERESLSPVYTEFTPVVKVALQRFQLMNESGVGGTWKNFGLWIDQKLLKGRDEIPKATIAKMEQLVANVDDPKEKTRIIYEYMQSKTRYVFIAIGIGGWQPSPAEEVDELSYGDCKGLTNYTKALLKTQGIESYYTIVDSGADGLDIDEDFVALQGDHVILAVPFEDETVFLECTSQTAPYNYMGDFTDDRKVLMITPEGGVITKTHGYSLEDNVQSVSAVAVFDENFKLSGTINETSEGILYGNKNQLESATTEEITRYYQYLWGHLNNLSVENLKFKNDKRSISFTESLNFESSNYVSKAGDRILLNPNVFTRYDKLPSEEKDRKLALKIRRGHTYRDKIELLIPDGYSVEAAFPPITLDTKFGTYKANIEKYEGSKLIYNRELKLNSGTFAPDEYNEYVNFIEQVVKKDKSKIVLSK